MLGRAELEDIPKAEGSLLLGNLSEFSQDAPGFLARLAREHGPLARFRVAHQTYTLVSDPELIEEILVRQSSRFHKHDRMRDTLGDALGEGLLTAEEGTWLEHRQLAQPAFRPGRIRTYGPSMVELTEAMVDGWTPGQRVPVSQAMMALTLRIASKTLFDVDVADQAQAIGRALDAIMARFKPENRLVSILPARLPLAANRRYRQGVDELARLIDGLIAERRAAGAPGQDLLSRLVFAGQAGQGLDDQALRDEMVTMLVAGHETTALALTWTFQLLGRHPEVEARLLDELQPVLDGQRPTAEDVDDLPYLEAVIDESMRLYPPAWAIGRKAIEPVELAGHTFPAGSQVMISQWVVHRDPAHYEDPLAFRPERWLGDLDERLPRFAYFPFGGGPRTCVGNSFAILEAKLIVATLLQRAHLEPLTDEMPGTDPSITLRPQGEVPMRFEPR